jgi:hypothetical protein
MPRVMIETNQILLFLLILLLIRLDLRVLRQQNQLKTTSLENGEFPLSRRAVPEAGHSDQHPLGRESQRTESKRWWSDAEVP